MVFMRVCQPEKLKKEFDKKFSAHMSNIEDHVLKDKSCAEILIGFIRKMDEETILQSAGRDRSFLCAQQCRNSCWGLWAYPLCVLGFFWEGQQVIRKSEFSTDKEIRFRKTSKPCRSKSTRFKAFFSFRREYWICLISSCSGYSPPVVEWSVSRPEQVYCLIYSVSSSY